MTARLAGLLALAESLPAGTAIPVPRELLIELITQETGEASGSREAVDIVPAELTQREAARLLRVSVSYLRASSCPKRLLPGNGPRGRALVRYLRTEVLAWGSARVLSREPRRKAS